MSSRMCVLALMMAVTARRVVLVIWHRARRLALVVLDRMTDWAGQIDTHFMLTD
ncbi:hypothetical protein [Streptomyces sp. NPDC053431]|uniref:hypothetical protein n=1 Tax=Streptomyces sp. NPDC053431 TaxID=3365703 RepID=UPI0037CCD194